MPKHPHLTRRGGVFWHRRKVPSDLRDHYAPKTHLTSSLRTSDPKEALCRVRKEAVRLDEEFDHIRRLRAAPVQHDLSDADIARLAALRLHEQLEGDETARRDGLGARQLYASVRENVLAVGGMVRWPTDGYTPPFGMNDREFAQKAETLEFVTPAMKAALARGDISVVADEVDEILATAGIKLDHGSASFRKLALAILKVDVEAYKAMAARQEGEPVATPPAPPSLNGVPPAAAPGPGDITVSALWELYVQERKPPPKTLSEFGTHLRRFREVNGDLPLRAVTKAHVRDFKDAMLKMPARMKAPLRKLTVPQLLERFANDTDTPRLSLASINSRALGAVSAVFGYAADNGYMENNPATGVKATGPANHGPSRLPYSPADLKAIFSSAVFTEGQRPAGGAGEAAKWLPLLALFTGARLDELGRLEVADVREEQDVTYLFIHGDGEGRRVKTRGSRRRVPVHPELARLGFLAYVAERKGAGDKRLFPALVSKRSQITAAFSTWWGRYTGRLGITDSRKVFHSFRHSVKRGLREAGVDPALSDALQGHSAKDVAGRYGSGRGGFRVLTAGPARCPVATDLSGP